MVSKATMSKKGNKRETRGLEQDYTDTYSKFKDFEDRRYAGMKKGKSRKWQYDPVDWEKAAQEEWEINYKIKRRAGHVN